MDTHMTRWKSAYPMVLRASGFHGSVQVEREVSKPCLWDRRGTSRPLAMGCRGAWRLLDWRCSGQTPAKDQTAITFV